MDKKLFRKLIYTRVDAVLEILGYVFLLGSILIAVAACAAGTRIVEKFDKAGNVIKYGPPAILFLMPGSMLFCNLLFSLVIHLSNPGTWNMPFKPRPGREIAVYRDMVRMQTVIEMVFGLYSLAFNIIMYRGYGEAMTPISILFMVAVLGDIVVMLAVYVRHNRM